MVLSFFLHLKIYTASIVTILAYTDVYFHIDISSMYLGFWSDLNGVSYEIGSNAA